MRFEKTADGERINVIDDDGTIIAYAEKQRFGTHGHWRGYLHYLFCDRVGKIIWAGEQSKSIYPEKPVNNCWENWTDAPPVFLNVKEIKAYYLPKEVKP